MADDNDLGFVPDPTSTPAAPAAVADDGLGFVADTPAHAAVSPVQSAIEGAIQGGTFGFGDELKGAYGGIKDTLTGSEPSSLATFMKNYQTARDQARQSSAQAQKDNPGYYTLGQVGGTLATSLLPGAGPAGLASKAAEGLIGGTRLAGPIAEGLLSGAFVGGAQGLGTSNADLTKGDVGGALKDVKQGAEVGGAVGAAFPAAKNALGAIGDSIGEIPSKLANIFLNTPEELTQSYIANPERILTASPSLVEPAQNISKAIGQLESELKTGSEATRAALAEEGNKIPGADISALLQGHANDIVGSSEGILDDPDKIKALNWLQKTADQYKNVDQVSTNRAHDFLNTLKNASLPIPEATKQDLTGSLDQLLQNNSPAYTQNVLPQQAKDAALLSQLQDIGTNPDQLVNVLKRAGRDNTQGATQALQDLGDKFGTDYLDQAKAAIQRNAFDKSVTNGSRNEQLYNNIGQGVGNILAESDLPFSKLASKVIAPVIGGTVDKYGRKLTQGAVDTAIRLQQIANTQGAQEFQKAVTPLVEFARQGDPAAVLTFKLLSGMRMRDQANQQ